MPRRNSTTSKFAVALLAITAPIAAWFLFKPLRALAPELAGVKCFAGNVCVDDSTRLEEARALRLEAIAFVDGNVGKLEHSPKVIFCNSDACDRSFGFTGNAAYNLGAGWLVVSKRGWQPYFLRHELIHNVQVERIGGLRMWFITPKWLIEGMAYSLSKDPRRPLQEPWEDYRATYEKWAYEIPTMQELWSRAKAL
jgi:hypothetical protein